jgi:hypothetical protein
MPFPEDVLSISARSQRWGFSIVGMTPTTESRRATTRAPIRLAGYAASASALVLSAVLLYGDAAAAGHGVGYLVEALANWLLLGAGQ